MVGFFFIYYFYWIYMTTFWRFFSLPPSPSTSCRIFHDFNWETWVVVSYRKLPSVDYSAPCMCRPLILPAPVVVVHGIKLVILRTGLVVVVGASLPPHLPHTSRLDGLIIVIFHTFLTFNYGLANLVLRFTWFSPLVTC